MRNVSFATNAAYKNKINMNAIKLMRKSSKPPLCCVSPSSSTFIPILMRKISSTQPTRLLTGFYIYFHFHTESQMKMDFNNSMTPTIFVGIRSFFFHSHQPAPTMDGKHTLTIYNDRCHRMDNVDCLNYN